MTDSKPARGVTAQKFFAAGVEGGSMTDAHHATRIAYSTVHRASRGDGVSLATARALEKWSQSLGANIFISALATLDIAPRDADEAPIADAAPEAS